MIHVNDPEMGPKLPLTRLDDVALTFDNDAERSAREATANDLSKS